VEPSYRSNNLKKMSSISYALRQAKYTLPLATLKVIYFAHVHSIISYGVIFWGNSSGAIKVFKLQKKIVRIITNIKPRDSCREVFKKMQILPLYSQYIYSLILFVVNNKYLFTANNEIHEYNTQNNNNLHPALSNLTKFNKEPSISGIKAFNHLPHYLKVVDYESSYFRTSLKNSFFITPFTLLMSTSSIKIIQ
jgi:hypothetical protein